MGRDGPSSLDLRSTSDLSERNQVVVEEMSFNVGRPPNDSKPFPGFKSYDHRDCLWRHF